jgi:hypothetical protein
MKKNSLKKPHNTLPKTKKKAEGGVAICPVCHAVYFDKHWHASADLHRAYKFHGEVEKCFCPVDDPKLNAGEGGWQGEIVLKNIHPDKKQEIMNQLRHASKKSMARNPEARVLRIEDKAGVLRVTTSSNKLAAVIGKALEGAHKGGKLEIKWSQEDLPCRVVWTMK